MNPLTERQQQILDFIRSYQQHHGSAPSRSEIAKALGFKSASAAEGHLRRMAAKGYLELTPGRNRNIRLCVEEVENRGLPIIGRVAAGSPILAEQNVEAYLDATGLFSPRVHFLLRVRGDSMTGAGIQNGDLLAVHKTPEAHDGQIVIARIDDEVTVKRLQRGKGGKIRLLPENRAYKAIVIVPEKHEFVIEGLAVGIIRSLN